MPNDLARKMTDCLRNSERTTNQSIKNTHLCIQIFLHVVFFRKKVEKIIEFLQKL
jgi:hypothetical protein